MNAAINAYTKTAKFLHWFIALLWIIVWILGMLSSYINSALTPVHKAIASTIIFLVGIRVIWRLTHPAPPLPNTMSNHAKQMALIGHIFLYVFALIALPLSGWLMSSFAGRPVMLAGLFQLPALSSPNPDYAKLVYQTHVYLAWFCGLLVLGHILIALKHHFIDKDTVLLSMAPCHGKKKG